MSARAATTNAEIIAAVATLTAQLDEAARTANRMERKLDAIETTVNGAGGHTEQRAAWKRNGKYLGVALTGLGAVGMTFLNWVLTHRGG